MTEAATKKPEPQTYTEEQVKEMKQQLEAEHLEHKRRLEKRLKEREQELVTVCTKYNQLRRAQLALLEEKVAPRDYDDGTFDETAYGGQV